MKLVGRYKVRKCPRCNGLGKIRSEPILDKKGLMVVCSLGRLLPCPKCRGTKRECR